jgi:hypothetical protein
MIQFQGKNKQPIIGKSYRFLSENDTILATDLYRETYWWNGSDYIDHDIFKRMNWAVAESQIPGWIGMTLKDFLSAVYEDGYAPEIIREL